MTKDINTNTPKDTQAEKNLESQESSKSSKNPRLQEDVELNKKFPDGQDSANQAEQSASSRWQSGPEASLSPNDDQDMDMQATAIELMQEENTKLREQLLRTVADMENLRKRTEKEKSNTAKYAISNFARDILSVGDNMRRAIEAVPENAASTDTALNTLIEGVEMTERELLSVLDRHGIKQINPLGEPFDPNQHQAVYEDANPEIAAGLCSTVVQPGYVIEDRILRPAMVGVSKGGTKLPKVERSHKESTGQDGVASLADNDAKPEFRSSPSRQGKAEDSASQATTQSGSGEIPDPVNSSEAGTRPQNGGEDGGKVGVQLDKNA